MQNRRKPFFTASRIAVIAVFSALSGVLYAFGISIPVLFAPWLELKFCDVPLLVGTFALGVPSGAICLVCRALLKLMIKPTVTVYVGELGDLLLGLALILPAGMIYQKRKTLRGAVWGSAVGAACYVIASLLVNRFALIPLYMKVNHWELADLANMVSALYKNCTAETFYWYYLWLSVLPFNVLQCTVNAAITFAVYKKVSSLIKRADEKFGEKLKKKSDKSAECAKNNEGSAEEILHEEEKEKEKIEQKYEKQADESKNSLAKTARVEYNKAMKTFVSKSAEETREFAEKYAKTLCNGDVLLLDGEMGAGKTVFVQGLAEGLGIKERPTSPTYAYMNDYDGRLFHYDCYRIETVEQAERLGLADYFDMGGICVVEWWQNVEALLPENCKRVTIKKLGENEREIEY